MAFDISVNLEYMFHEAGDRLEDRVAAAARAGFTHAEIFTTADRDVPRLARALADHGVALVTLLVDPRTRLIDRDTHAGFRDLFRQAAESAVALGCPRVVVGSGPGVPYMKRPAQLALVAEAVAGVVPIAEELGLTVVLEPVNTRVDHPGVLFSQTIDAVEVIRQVASPRVRLLYDLYHSITEGEDPAAMLAQHGALVDHVQVADVPGRGEPGSGTIDWPAMLGLLRQAGYHGTIGVECTPTRASTTEALVWFRALCAAGAA
jgi:hydroxypyruvate isomerase